MNKKKKKQNGFTIVELVIVIAVIGILAAILIPTFSNLVKKAKQSADQQLVYHINEAVVANEVDNLAKGKNGTEATMYDTLQALENDYGFTIEKMTPRSGNDIIWDSTTNRFALVAKDGTIVYDDPNKPSDMTNKAQMWRITEAGEKLDDGYAHYLTAGWSGEVPAVSTGLDVGDNDDITAVTYDSSSDASAVVRTNGGTLTVVAPNGTVKHYGEADKVDVQAVANASYHENGVVKLIAVKKGHVELEGEAEVNGIYVYNNSQGETKDTSFAEIKITVDNGVDIPKFSRSAVKIADEGTKVCTVVTDQAKDIYLFNQGIYEQMKVADAGAAKSTAKWVDTTAAGASANTQTAAMQLANEFNGTYDTEGNIENATVTVGETTYTVVFNNTSREFETYAGYVDENDKGTKVVVDTTNEETQAATQAILDAAATEVSTDSGKTADEAATASALKGTGTQKDPFMIYDYETMQMISDFYDKGYYYFEVALDKTDNGKIDCTGWVPVKLHGSFDGKGVKFTNVTACLFQIVGYQLQNENIVLKDFDATMNVSANGQYGAAALIKNIFNAGVTTFDNVKVHGYLEGFWNMGSFYNYGTANYDDVGCDYEVVFNDCYSDATLVCGSGNTCGGFAGHSYEGEGNQFIMRINNSSYAGTIFTTTGKSGAYIAMSSNHGASGENGNYIYVDGVRVEFNDGNNMSAYYYNNTSTITKVNPTKAQNGYVITKQTNVSKIVVTITAQLTAYDANNVKIDNLSGITMTLSSTELNDLDGSSIKVLDLFNSVNISKNTSDFNAVINNNVLNISLASSSNYKSGNIRLQVNQYDSTGSIVSAGTIDIATCADATSNWIVK